MIDVDVDEVVVCRYSVIRRSVTSGIDLVSTTPTSKPVSMRQQRNNVNLQLALHFWIVAWVVAGSWLFASHIYLKRRQR